MVEATANLQEHWILFKIKIMFKLFILFILFVNSCNNNNRCEFSEKEITKVLKIFYVKSILEEYQNEISFEVTGDKNICIPDSLQINDRIVHIRSQKTGIPNIFITKIIPNQDKIMVLFKVIKPSSRRYQGEIIFKCIDNKLEYRDIYYYSAIE